ncbi:MAG: hypothetical protein DLM59_18800 [Pseudonocardiales bacterium]|nr:MAG: hypothetical protein DLM59_18800 [Pseudonocardiales bacterium]
MKTVLNSPPARITHPASTRSAAIAAAPDRVGRPGCEGLGRSARLKVATSTRQTSASHPASPRNRAVRCQRNTVITTPLATTTAVHTRARRSHRVTGPRASTARPISQTAWASRATVGGRGSRITEEQRHHLQDPGGVLQGGCGGQGVAGGDAPGGTDGHDRHQPVPEHDDGDGEHPEEVGVPIPGVRGGRGQ